MADGNVELAFDLDTRPAESSLDKLKKKVLGFYDDLYRKNRRKNLTSTSSYTFDPFIDTEKNLNKQLTKLEAERDKLLEKRERQAEQLREHLEGPFGLYEQREAAQSKVNVATSKLDTAYAGGKPILDRYVQLENAKIDLKVIDAQIDKTEAKLDAIVNGTGRWGSRLNDVLSDLRIINDKITQRNAFDAIEAGAEAAEDELEDVQTRGEIFIDTFKLGLKAIGTRLKNMAIRSIFFATFGKAIRSFISYTKETLLATDSFSASLARLKGNLLVIYQVFIQLILPILQRVIDFLVYLTSWITKFFGALSKNSLASAKKMAKSLAVAGKEAKKTLADFDELHIIGKHDEGNDKAVAPDFSGVGEEISPELEETFRKIAYWAAVIGAAIATWKLANFINDLAILLNSLSGLWGTIWKIALVLIAVYATYRLIKEYADAWVNGIDWENFWQIMLWLGIAVTALGLAFGMAVIPLLLMAYGIGLIVLAVHDMLNNGPNLLNLLVLAIGYIGVLVSLFLSGHAKLTLFLAVLGLVIGAVATFGEEGDNLFKHFTDIVDGIKQMFNSLLENDIDGFFEGLKTAGKGMYNFLVDIFEGLVNIIIKCLNLGIEAINKLQFDVPDWVPVIGGNRLGLSIPTVPLITNKIPRLAQGAVIPPNNEFAAILGDQKRGTNIETPLDTMIQAFTAALDARGGQEIEVTVRFEGSEAQFVRGLVPQITAEYKRLGVANPLNRLSANGGIV